MITAPPNPWETKTIEHLTVHELVDWVEWYAHRQGCAFDAQTIVHNVLLWERNKVVSDKVRLL